MGGKWHSPMTLILQTRSWLAIWKSLLLRILKWSPALVSPLISGEDHERPCLFYVFSERKKTALGSPFIQPFMQIACACVIWMGIVVWRRTRKWYPMSPCFSHSSRPAYLTDILSFRFRNSILEYIRLPTSRPLWFCPRKWYSGTSIFVNFGFLFIERPLWLSLFYNELSFEFF